MTGPAWESPQQVVAGLLEEYGLSSSRADSAAAAIFDTLCEPDRDMLDAGGMELRTATQLRVAESKRVAERVWLAMLRKACT